MTLSSSRSDPRVDRLVAQAAREVCPDDPSQARAVERFLRTGRRSKRYEIPKGDISRWMDEAQANKSRCEQGLRRQFTLLSGLLPPEARKAPGLSPSKVREQVRPMVEGLLPLEWRDTALRELGDRIFVLNSAGARP